MYEKKENNKKNYGGIFVILTFCFAVFNSFDGAMFHYEQTVGNIIGVWAYFLCTIFIYGILKSTAKSGDFTMIAGYDPKKNYNKTEFAEMIRYITLGSSFFGCFYSGLYLLMPLIGKNERSLFDGIITVAYVISLALSIFVVNIKYKDRILQQEEI